MGFVSDLTVNVGDDQRQPFARRLTGFAYSNDFALLGIVPVPCERLQFGNVFAQVVNVILGVSTPAAPADERG